MTTRLRQLAGIRLDDPRIEQVRRDHHDAIAELQRLVRELDSAVVSVFTATASGTAPASGGGAVNFLRADGTWAPPSGASVADGDKGDITVSGSGATWTIDNSAVTLAKISNIATARILGRVTAGAGVVEELTATQVTALLNVFTSALRGLVPASGGGTSTFLRADATWGFPATDIFYGDGSDGNVTISAGTTTLTREMFYANLTIASGATLRTAGYPIHISGTLTFADSTATISWAGNQGNDATTTANGSGATTLATGMLPAVGVTAGNGGQPPSAASGNVNGTYQGNTATGGAGGRGNFHAGGAGSAIGTIAAATTGGNRTAHAASIGRTTNGTSLNAVAGAGGGGGGAQFANQAYGGGGGGGGGWQVVCAKAIVHTTGTGVLTAAGGRGGNGNVFSGAVDVGGGGGGGGGGGVNVLIYGNGTLPTITVSGGAGGTAVNSGTPANPAVNGIAGGSGMSLVFRV